MCSEVLTIRGDRILARRIPRGLAEKGKQKCI